MVKFFQTAFSATDLRYLRSLFEGQVNHGKIGPFGKIRLRNVLALPRQTYCLDRARHRSVPKKT